MQDTELEHVYRLALHVSNEKDFESEMTVENDEILGKNIKRQSY